jgi:hypothetical protein
MHILTAFPGYFLGYVKGLGLSQLIEVGVIALFFGMAAPGVASVIFLPIVAVIVYLAVDAVVPVVLHNAPLVVPAFDNALLEKAVALYVLLLAACIVVFAIKKIVLGIRG